MPEFGHPADHGYFFGPASENRRTRPLQKQRKVEQGTMTIVRILSFLIWSVLTLWSRTLTIRLVNKASPDRLAGEGKNVIYAFWHDSMFLLPYAHRNWKVEIMVSESKDGEIAAGILRRFGFEVARGSSKRKGSRALIKLISSIQSGRSVGIAVDGPRGPRHEAKEGAVFLAGKLMVPIVPVATAARRCWTLNRTWDQFILPVPFTGGVVLYGEPIVVNGTSREEIAAKRDELEAALHRLTREAAERSGASGRGERPAIGNESSPARNL
jgi:hypothetical protein